MNAIATLSLLMAGTLSAFTAISQPVLNEQYHATVGNRFSLNEIADTAEVVVPTQGANQSWNFAGITGGMALTGAFETPGHTGSGAFFPGSNAVLSYSVMGMSIKTYMSNGPQGATVQGFYAAGELTTYSPAMYIAPGGLAFGDFSSYEGMEKRVEVGATDTAYTFNKETLRYVGYGSLTLPSGSYSNVALVRVDYFSDVADSPAGPFAPYDSGTRYYFLAPGIGYPVLEMTRGQIFSGPAAGPDVYGSYLDNVVTAAKPRLAFKQVSLRPTPARDFATMSLPQGEDPATAVVMDQMGRRVAELPMQQGRISLQGLQPGAYWVEVRGKNTYRATLIKE